VLLLALSCTEYDLKEKGEEVPVIDTETPVVEDTTPPLDTVDTSPPVDSATCAGWDSPGDYETPVDEDCIAEPTTGTFNPAVEWQWTQDVNHGSTQVMSTPAVANLNDDDGDGDIDEDDIPDIVFTSYWGQSYGSAGVLTAISGDGTGTLWSLKTVSGKTPYGAGGVAVGDLEGDGQPDVCVAGSNVAIICVEGDDGSFKWANGAQSLAYGAPSIADLDADGTAEVVFGTLAFDSDGSILGYGNTNVNFSVPVDWDGDGDLEIHAGNRVYEPDGTQVWSSSGGAHPAIADFDGDGKPDVVTTGNGYAQVHLNNGSLLWQTQVPGGGGGPPTVADFDGDGQPEVGVAGKSKYSVFETSGAVRWSNVTEDDSSSVTGSSVFDFEGDGRAEVVYADEHNLWVYAGDDGTVLLQMTDHGSGTLYEYPVIADVDRDGATEIVLPSNNMWWGNWTGITVIGDVDESWAPARPIWNQYGYSITNINADGSVPQTPTSNWSSWNNFRAGGTELGPSHWRANLKPVRTELCLDDCDQGLVHVEVAVLNNGLVDSDAFSMTFANYEGASEVRTEVSPGIDSGWARWQGPFTFTEEEWLLGFQVTVDSLDEQDECYEDDNVLLIGDWPCPD
jgi:hypothetical protein